jgi:hypothetical protein
MIQKISTGILIGALIGVFTTSFFLPVGTPFKELFFTKITATSIITGLLTSVYYYLSKSKLQVFLICILIGVIVFYTKYLVTGHHFDPVTMGAFVGALLGGVYAIIRKVTHSIKLYKRLERLKKRGFRNYG